MATFIITTESVKIGKNLRSDLAAANMISKYIQKLNIKSSLSHISVFSCIVIIILFYKEYLSGEKWVYLKKGVCDTNIKNEHISSFFIFQILYHIQVLTETVLSKPPHFCPFSRFDC